MSDRWQSSYDAWKTTEPADYSGRPRRAHTHPCAHCRTPVDCPGDLERNYDGWPEVICTFIHRADGTTVSLLCQDCS